MMMQTGHHSTASPFRRTPRAGLLLLVAVLVPVPAHGEDGHEAWLRYAPVHDAALQKDLAALPAVVVSK